MAVPIQTYINAGEDEIVARERAGFVAAERYNALTPQQNELGAIVRQNGSPRMERGMFVQPIEVLERIFIRERNG